MLVLHSENRPPSRSSTINKEIAPVRLSRSTRVWRNAYSQPKSYRAVGTCVKTNVEEGMSCVDGTLTKGLPFSASSVVAGLL
jgi:hypothetical protein